MTSCDVLATRVASACRTHQGGAHYSPQSFNRLSMATGK